MPIVYNHEEQSFTLQEPTDEEKNALFNLAIEHITGMFGEQVANSVIRDAAEYHKQQVGKKDVIVSNLPVLN